jgi:hypothetical protein
MGYGCFLPRAGYAAFFEREIPEKHVLGGYLAAALVVPVLTVAPTVPVPIVTTFTLGTHNISQRVLI